MSSRSHPVLLIDVDGVIVTGRDPDGANWSEGLMDRFGFDKSALRTHFFGPYWADIVTGKDTLLPRLSEALRNMETDTSAADLRDFWFANDARLSQPMLDWMNARRATGQRVMLATNQDHSRAHYLMNTLLLRDHCDGIYYSAALGVAKPDPAFFTAIAAAEKQPPFNLILIDDTLENVTAARRSGWQAHHYTGQNLDHVI